MRSYILKLKLLMLQLDNKILFAILSLMVIGFLLVLSSSPVIANRIEIDQFYFVKNQIIYSILAVCVLFIIASLSSQHLKYIIIIGFIVSCILLMIALLVSVGIKGSRRWVYLFGFSLQPSEFVKVLFPSIFAYLWQTYEKSRISKPIFFILIFLIYSILIMLFLLEPDLGSAVFLSLIFMLLLFVIRINFNLIIGMLFLITLLIFISYFIFNHVQVRINSFFAPQGRSYQIEKSLQAIEEGHILGKGAGQGDVKSFLPDAHTDFIFAVGQEEYGLFFTLLLFLLYLTIILRVFIYLDSTNNNIKILILAGNISVFAIQIAMHIASNIKLIPTKGVTLPLISYGGSSLIATVLLLGIILNLVKKDIQY